MIRLSAMELAVAIPMRGYVITTTVMRSDVLKIGEVELALNTSYREIKHQPIVQRVVRVPRFLPYGKVRRFVEFGDRQRGTETLPIDAPVPGSMEWLTTMELRTDDTVYVDPYALFNAARENRVIECDDVRYFMVPYGDIYMRIVNGHPEMLNGWIACEPVPDEKSRVAARLKSLGLVMPSLSVSDENRRERGEDDKLAVVKYIGLPVREYLDDTVEEHDQVSVGDVVILKWSANRRLEFDAGRFFGKGELIITRRPRIVGKMSEDLF